jgi:hypothetical protein
MGKFRTPHSFVLLSVDCCSLRDKGRRDRDSDQITHRIELEKFIAVIHLFIQ